MPELDASKHPHGQIGAPPEGGLAVATRAVRSALQYLDVVLVVAATPLALALGAPAFGLIIGVIAWIAQRALAQADKRLVARAAEPRTRLGLSLFEAFGRIWLLAGAIILAGVACGRPDGLTAALVIFCAYSIALAIRVLAGRPSPPPGREVAG